jgi:hypothetical protein
MSKYNFSHLISVPSELIEILELVDQKKAEIVYRSFTIDKNVFLTIDVKLPKFSEDTLYNDDKIRTLIPRGLCFIFVNNKHCHTIYGHPKFGNFGDYKSKDIILTKKVFRRKENGECAHWGAFEYNDIIYEVYGSKNVHLIVRSTNFDDDIKLYSEMRYSYAIKMANLINNKCSKKCIEYLVATKNTFCAEGCFTDSQHIVNYPESTIFFFAITSQRSYTSPITKVSPIEADELFLKFGLNTVSESIILNSGEDESEICKYFECQPNSEGAVVNCLDADNNTVYVYKHKNYDYIFFRALREQMRKHAPSSRIMLRFKNLHIEHPEFDKMINYAFRFNAYFRQLTDFDQKNFFSQWVTHKNIFDSLSLEEQTRMYDEYQTLEKKCGTVNVILFVAIPGSGKSFVARVLKGLLEAQGKTVAHLEQDMFFHLGKNASKHYDKAVETVSKDKSIEYIILTKSNHTEAVREKTYAILDKCGRNVDKTFVVMTANDYDMSETFKICVDRAVKRGYAHTSLYGKSENELKSIIGKVFIEQFEQLNDEELCYNVVNLNINQEKTDVIKSCVEQLQKFSIISLDDKLVDMHLERIYSVINAEDIQQAEISKKKGSGSSRKKPSVGYDALVFNDADLIIDMLPKISINIDKHGLNKKKEFHVTLKYYGGKPIDDIEEFEDDVNYDVQVIGYAVDDKALALYVKLPKNLQDKYKIEYPHITYALKKDIKAVYSGTLIKNAIESDSYIHVIGLSLTGTTKRVIM